MKASPLLLLPLLFLACNREKPLHAIHGEAFGTIYEIMYAGAEDNLRTALQSDSLFRACNSQFSIFDSLSLISRLNRNETDSLDEGLCKVIRRSLELSEATGGAFDITVGPLVNAWGFGNTGRQMPSQQTVDSLMQLTGYRKIQVDDSRIRKDDKRIQLNLNAIVKGYIVDRTAELLGRRHPDLLVNIGGEIACRGKRPNGQPWTIGIQLPTNDSMETGTYTHRFHLQEGKAVATSGDYRRYLTDSTGRRYSHIIDPRTGRSEQSDLLSATVIAEDCMTADAVATACMVLGKKGSLELMAGHPEWAACLISHENGKWAVTTTRNFPKSLP